MPPGVLLLGGDMSLTPRQARFVQEYLVDLNGKQAAIRSGYAEKGAEVTASKLLMVPKVKRAVMDAKAARSERTKIDADWLLSRLAEEADADMADLYDAAGALRPVSEWPPIWRKGLVQGLDVEEMRGPDGAVVGQVRKVKISDRVKRLELIGRHIDVGAFRDRIEHTGKDGGPIQTQEMSTVEAARRVAFLLAKGAHEAAQEQGE